MRHFTLLFLISAITLGCSTGKKALEKGNYDQAVYQAVSRLQSNSDSKKAKSTLKDAYRYALGLHMDNIKRFRELPGDFQWEQIVSEYQSINSLHDQIKRCPACMQIVTAPMLATTELNTAIQKAAENRYDMGMEAMQFKEDRNKAIEAHQHFLKANNYVPRYKDTEQLMDEALFFAMLRVVVEPIPDPSRIYKLDTRFFENKVNEQLHKASPSPYVSFFTPSEADRTDPEWIDHVVQMRFDQFTLGNLVSNKYTENVVRDSVLVKDRNGESSYNTVRAILTVNERSILGTGALDMQIIDLSLDKVTSQQRFANEYNWTARWATYSGDERALSQEQKDLTKMIEVDIPLPQRIFEEFSIPFYGQVIDKLNRYYSNY